MRLRHITGSEEYVAKSSFVVHEPEQKKGQWQAFFGNDHPIHVEIGMGKGQFIEQMALQHPDINYIGIERYDTVLLKALKKREALMAEGATLQNLTFLSIDARLLADVFEAGEVARIYLNFSDPWPKDRHAKRRLPSRQFLARYDQILAKDGTIEFKTDNRGLFDFALEEVEPAGWRLLMHTFDLHADAELMKDNIMTEYEEKFASKGNPICKMIIDRVK